MRAKIEAGRGCDDDDYVMSGKTFKFEVLPRIGEHIKYKEGYAKVIDIIHSPGEAVPITIVIGS